MKNILLFASLAGIAAAIAIYFTAESNKISKDNEFFTDVDVEDYNMRENTGPAESFL